MPLHRAAARNDDYTIVTTAARGRHLGAGREIDSLLGVHTIRQKSNGPDYRSGCGVNRLVAGWRVLVASREWDWGSSWSLGMVPSMVAFLLSQRGQRKHRIVWDKHFDKLTACTHSFGRTVKTHTVSCIFARDRFVVGTNADGTGQPGSAYFCSASRSV